MVLQEKFPTREECEDLGRRFVKYELNKYFSYRVQCVEDVSKET